MTSEIAMLSYTVLHCISCSYGFISIYHDIRYLTIVNSICHPRIHYIGLSFEMRSISIISPYLYSIYLLSLTFYAYLLSFHFRRIRKRKKEFRSEGSISKIVIKHLRPLRIFTVKENHIGR